LLYSDFAPQKKGSVSAVGCGHLSVLFSSLCVLRALAAQSIEECSKRMSVTGHTFASSPLEDACILLNVLSSVLDLDIACSSQL
jgi:hypothetical protein